jgi:predicted N-formylglutamate amidohydrolase
MLTRESNSIAMPARLCPGNQRERQSMSAARKAEATLLARSDPDPVEVVNPNGTAPVLLVCEHAGRAVPAALHDLGVPVAEMDRHIAYDIGAEELARRLSGRLDATLVLQRYSRLVIDCNRPIEAVDCMAEVSDGTPISMNCGLAEADRMLRLDEIHRPFHDAIVRLIERRQREARPTVIVAIHTFTPRFAGRDRPWQLGVCFNRDGSFAARFMRAFQTANPAISAACNEPYPVNDLSDYTIPVHGERRGLPHVLLEIRNDQLADASGKTRWARLIGRGLTEALAPVAEPSHGA